MRPVKLLAKGKCGESCCLALYEQSAAFYFQFLRLCGNLVFYPDNKRRLNRRRPLRYLNTSSAYDLYFYFNIAKHNVFLAAASSGLEAALTS